MTDRKIYFIKSNISKEAAEKAFSWLIQKKKVFLAVMGHRNLNGIISKVVEQKFVGRLKKDGRAIISGTEVILVTKRKPIHDGNDTPLVAFYPATRFLDQLVSIPNVSEILVVPHSLEALEPWIKMWNATELGASPQPRQMPLSNLVVRQALKNLTRVVNVSTGIAHPRDKETTIQILEILRDGGEMFTPEEVKAYLVIECDWKAKYAQEVAEIAQKVLKYKRLSKGGPVLRYDTLKIWREKAAKTKKRNRARRDHLSACGRGVLVASIVD
jgi:hypothetical protein